jgi:hypothetical protein
MSHYHKTQLRQDSPNYPAFQMVPRPSESPQRTVRIAEWVLATWMSRLDSNILGIRRVDEERNGQVVPMIHIAIPLGYQRRQLAQTLAVPQLEDEQNTPRVNLIASAGFDEPHSFIRVPAEILLNTLSSFLRESISTPMEINDHTVQVSAEAVEDFIRESQQQRRREEEGRLRSAVQHGLAMRNAPVFSDQIQILVHKKTQEKWVRIQCVDQVARTTVKLAIQQAGIEAATPAQQEEGDGSDWALLFPASEAPKLLQQ